MYRLNQFDNNKARSFVGIDYEFIKHKIALMQLNFENIKTNSMIHYMFLINPAELDSEQTKILIDVLMSNKYIFKIFHGADSLDIPYTYNELLNNNLQNILKFTYKFVDTRFLCEYYRGSVGTEKKCSIYDALKYFDVIDSDKYDFLINTHDLMGPVQDISWNIHKLSSYHTKYAYYDVLFLPTLFEQIYKKAFNQTPKFYKFYRYLNIFTRFVLLERKDKLDITTTIKNNINHMNNYLIKDIDGNKTLIQMYNNIVTELKIEDEGFEFQLIMNVNYFKSTIVLLLKNIIYSAITNKYPVFINKNEKLKHKLKIDNMYQSLEEYKFKKLVIILKKIHNKIINNIYNGNKIMGT